MRVLVLSSGLTAGDVDEAGTATAAAWADLGHQVALVPIAASGPALSTALRHLVGPKSAVVSQPATTSTAAIGRAIADALSADPHPDRIVVDLTSAQPADGGAPLMAEMAGMPESTAPAETLAGAAQALGQCHLIAAVPADSLDSSLTGVQGVAARHGAEREHRRDLAEVLEHDRQLASLARAWGQDPAPPGAGAAGGTALAVLALGGTVQAATELLADLAGLQATVAAADLVVLVLPALDFGGSGVELAATVSRWVDAVSTVCIVVAGRVQISSRELRVLGVQSAYAVPPTSQAVDLAAAMASIARTWSW